MRVFYNGQFLENTSGIIDPFASGFQFGYGFFSTLKYQDGEIHHFDAHLMRLKKSLSVFRMPFPELDYESVLRKLIEVSDMESARLKIMLFENGEGKTDVYIQAVELRILSKTYILEPHPALRGRSEIFKHKSMSHMDNIFNRREALRKGIDDFIYEDYGNNVLETSSSNIFFVGGAEIITPHSSLPLLPGIIRDKLLSSGRAGKYTIRETYIKSSELRDFDGAFLTNSIIDTQPVGRIGDISYDTGMVEEIINEVEL